MAVSLSALLFTILPAILGLVFLGAGGFALYEGFAKDVNDEIWLASPTTARIIGIIALLVGLALLCTSILAFFAPFFIFAIAPPW